MAAKNTKLVSEDESQSSSEFFDERPFSPKKTLKRAGKNECWDEDISKLIGQNLAGAKKIKAETSSGTHPESRKMILDLVGNQLQARKQCNENLFKRLAEITAQVEADYNVMKENEQKLEHITSNYMKCMQQATTAYKHKLTALKEINSSLKKE